MVISGGVNIYPREIEECLFQHPEVVDVAVLGVPDDEWGEVFYAVVQRTPGSELDTEAVVAWCREHIADYKRPRDRRARRRAAARPERQGAQAEVA